MFKGKSTEFYIFLDFPKILDAQIPQLLGKKRIVSFFDSSTETKPYIYIYHIVVHI